MASIRKQNGKWQVQVRRRGFAHISRTFHQRTDAEQWARYMEVKADRGELPVPKETLEVIRVRDIIERYKDQITVKKRSADTEEYILEAFLRHPIASLTLTQLTSAHFSTYRDKRLKEVKPGTVNRELGIIKHAFTIAEREWDIPLRMNPLDKIQKLKANNARTRRLTNHEFKALQEAATKSLNQEILTLVRFAIATGMRRGEMLNLRWSDIDFSTSTLHIPVTKNGCARTIPLSFEALSVLTEINDNRPQDKCTGYVFSYSGNAAQLAWQRLVKRAKIEDLHFHDLRHEAISRFFEQGLSVPEVALISGHRDSRMLFRYTHLKAEDIAAKLNPPPTKEKTL